MNHYDHMSVMINFLTLKLKIHTASNSEIEGRTENVVKYRMYYSCIYEPLCPHD